MRVLFLGGTRRGYLALQTLVEAGAELVGVLSLRQDEHEAERYERPIADLASKLHIPLYQTKWLNDRDYADIIRSRWRPDIAFVVGCRLRLPREMYAAPPTGTLAIHDSLLPEYRGFAPLNWAILNGADHTGVTLFYMTDQVDAGDIVAQHRVPIGPDDTAAEVYERVCAATSSLLRETYPLLVAGRAPRRPQDESLATYTCPRVPADGLIDWDAGTLAIHNQVRALTRPYPGAFTYLDTRRLTIWRAGPVKSAPHYAGRIPGRVVAVDRSHGTVDVLTGDGALRLHEVQLEGGDPEPASAVIRSMRATLGTRLTDVMLRMAEPALVGGGRP